MARLIGIVLLLVGLSGHARGHGRLMEPVGRSSAWRLGYQVPRNYDDNALFCGGFATQQNNGGQCGVCGDPYNGVRENEPPNGRYATGTIVKTYQRGQVIMTKADITANHHGYMQYRLCPHNDVSSPVTQACLDKHVLQRADGNGTKVMIPGGVTGYFNVEFQLPPGITCTQCVIQWRYHTANSWGMDADTHQGCVGCGAQEEFYACADVAITPEDGILSVPRTHSTHAPTTHAPFTRPLPTTTIRARTTTQTRPRTTRLPSTTRRTTTIRMTPSTRKTVQPTRQPTVHSDFQTIAFHCRAINDWAGIDSMDLWCTENCAKGDCPPYGCDCNDGSASTQTTLSTTLRPTTTSSTTIKPTTTSSTTTKPTTTSNTTTKPTTTSSTTTKPTTKSSTTTKPTTTSSTTTRSTTTSSTTTKPTTRSTTTRKSTTTPTTKTPTKQTTTSRTTANPTPVPTSNAVPASGQYVGRIVCKAINLWAGNTYLDRWCADACARGNCPDDSCRCSKVQTLITNPTAVVLLPLASEEPTQEAGTVRTYGQCAGIGEYKDIEPYDIWCAEECKLGNCQPKYCSCLDSTLAPILSTVVTQRTTQSGKPSTPEVTSKQKCVPNGVVGGDYWINWCQERCNVGDCEVDYCFCS